MTYIIREIINKLSDSDSETDYLNSPSEMLDFKLFTGDFYKLYDKKIKFKEYVEIADFDQIVKVFPAFEGVQYRSRRKLPYFIDNLDALVQASKNGEKIAVEGGPCLFGSYEVSIIVYLKDGSSHLFDYANGKAYIEGGDFSEAGSLANFLREYGDQVTKMSFKSEKLGLTPQEYLGLRYPFEIASAWNASLVIPIPDMSYNKWLLAVLEFVSEDIRSKAIEDFKEISNIISSFYKDAIFDLQNKYKIKEFCCVHKDSENELNIWYEKRKPFIERNKIVRNLTTLSEKLEPIKDYVSMPALPYYLFGAKNILEVNSMDETDPYHKCKKAHKNDLQMGCILYPELLSKDKVHTLYNAPIEFKQYGNLEQLSNNYEAKE